MATPLFILSFRHRDELSRLSESAGWQPIAARRADNAEARFIASGAGIALVDARGALKEGQQAVRAIGEAVEANASALLLLLSRTDSESLDLFHQLGATHFLVSPFTEAQLLHSLRFAQRHAERVGGVSRFSRRAGEEAVSESSWHWRPGSDRVELSPSLAEQAGLDPGDPATLPLRTLLRRMGQEGRRSARSAIARALDSKEATAFAHSDPAGDPAGRIVHHVRVDPEGGLWGRTETIAGDPGRATGRDPLTGLRDSRSAKAWLEGAMEREGGAVALLLSVSRFDHINAAFGRSTGNAVLQAVARRIERLVAADGRTRFVARLAGAEFAVFLSFPATAADGRFLADELVRAVSRPFLSGDHVITVASRAGVAASKTGDDPSGLIRRASAALAEAKSGDGAPVRVLAEGAEVATARSDRLEVDLRRALDKDEIEIRFQPQVAIASGEIVGAEALARWCHPEFGELGAETLFLVAERSDYLATLSDHVQRKAVMIAAGWPSSLVRLRLSVNITAADILRPGFADQFIEMVQGCGFAPARLTVEVTESGLIEDLAGAAGLLARLRSAGFRVAIDDFGTGYSSLAYLKALPLDYLKIDKRLSEDITGSTRDRIVVRGVIDMARSLGIDVVAEGVESRDQLALLAQEGCTLYQGFLCAPPLTGAALIEMVSGSQQSAMNA